MRNHRVTDKSNLPLVSIGLPTYNGAATLTRALDALVSQDYPNVELIIADDASSDETPDICRRYAAAHPHIRFTSNPKNLGSYENVVQVLRMARGPYFVWASQDDYWAPQFLSKLVGRLEREPDAVAAMSATKFFWDDGTDDKIVRFQGADNPEAQTPLKLAVSLITKRSKAGNIIKTNTYGHGVVRTKAFRSAVNAFPGIFTNERQIICQWALAGRLLYVDEVLFEKQQNRVPLRERHPNDPLVHVKAESFYAIRYAYRRCVAIICCSIIPFRRKLLAPVIAFHYLKKRLIAALYTGGQRLLPTLLFRLIENSWRTLKHHRSGASNGSEA